MANELKALGHDVEVVTGIPNYPRAEFFSGYRAKLYQRETMDGIVVHRTWLYPAMGGGLKRLLNYLSFAISSFIGLWRADRADYIFVESPPLFLSVPAVLVSRLKGSQIIFSVSDLWPDAIAQGGFVHKGFGFRCLETLEAWSYQRAAYVNAVTEGIRKVLLEEKRVPAGKILYLPNGVDTERFLPRTGDASLRARLGLDGKRIVLWAGTLGFAHGLENVLFAASLLVDHSEIHFLFVGDGSAKPQLQKLAAAKQLRNVTFLDPVSNRELAAYISIATAGLASLMDIPLHDGARPSKMFPVLASGRPLIFVGRGEAARLIHDAGAGIVVSPGDPEALAAAVLELTGNPGLADCLGQRGRTYVENHLQWSKLIGDWVKKLEAPGVSRAIESTAVNA
jgi:glycosyltransferase involved in cell wall biosynthesis